MRRLPVRPWLLVLLLLAVLVGLPIACGYIHLPGGLIVNFPGFSGNAIPEAELREQLKVPDGFYVNTYASGIANARLLQFTPSGRLLVSSPQTGNVWVIDPPTDGGGYSAAKRVLIGKLYQPHGLALHDGWLYIAETTAIVRVRYDDASGTVSGEPERIVTGLPDGGNHWTRTVGVGPDGKLYVSIGSSCNVCIEEDARRAAIVRYELDGSGEQLYATGLRNAVDFDWQPGTGDLYATDNGRDLLGDDFPPCEFNKVIEGGFYGWPIANGDRVPDPDYGAGNEARIAASIPPAHGFGAHTAPLGMTFYRRPSGPAPVAFPADWDGVAFVALHGSWNRSTKLGYEVVALRFAADGTIGETPFLTGLLADDKVYGRPVDTAVGPDGALYVSDDYTGAIYRVAYGTPARGGTSAPTPTAIADPFVGVDTSALPAMQERGAALWQTHNCASCHVEGQAAAAAYKPLVTLGTRYTVDTLANFLRTPQPPMPVFPLDDQQRRDLAVYLLKTN